MFKVNIFDKHYNDCNISNLDTNEVINIDPNKLKGYFDEDIVLYNNNNIEKLITPSEKRKNIVGILKITNKTLFCNNKNKILYLFEPFDKKLPNFLVSSKFTDHNKYTIINFLSWDSDIPRGEVVNYLGNTNCHKSLSKSLTHFHIKNLKNLNNKFINYNSNETNNTNIFNNYDNIFSIDPNGCTDIDDVISFKKINEKNVIIGIHITDITYYLQNSPDIFNILHNRVSTIYTNYDQINMLPNKFATNICSLHPKMPKKVISLILNIDEYNINSFHFEFNTIISENAYSYEEANKKLSNHPLNSITKNITKKILPKYNFDKWDFHNVIEVLMIITNHYVAKTLIDKNIIIPLRTQKESLLVNYSNNNELNKFLNIYNSKSAEYINSSTFMNHYTIGLNCYTHFTSPIRRYIDVFIHLKMAQLLGRNFNFNINIPNCEYINKINNNIKKLSYDLNKLSLIDKSNNDIEIISGYIIKVLNNTNNIIIYIPKYKVTLISSLIPNKLLHIFNIDLKNNIITITNKKNNNITILNLFSKYDFKIIYQLCKETINDKIDIYLYNKINLTI